MIKGLSPRAQKLLVFYSQRIARNMGSTLLYPEHVVLAILELTDCVAYHAMHNAGVNTLMLELALRQNMPKTDSAFTTPNRDSDIPPSRRLRSLLDTASVESRSLRHEYIGTEHLLLAAIREDNSTVARYFMEIPLTLDEMRQTVINTLKEVDSSANGSLRGSGNGGRDGDTADTGRNSDGVTAGKKRGNSESQGSAESFLAEFSKDLTAQVRNGTIDPVVGRDREIQRLIQILSRRNKNNPVLVGEPGVGKTAIVEGLAQRIVSETVPGNLINKRVIVLDLALVIAGTKYRGEFEERMKRIIKEIQEQKNIIIFIDELHTLIGAGGAEGSMDASNMLKPALSRGELQCIGATTLKEYRKYFEKDAALERRFQIVQVNEPSDKETEAILEGIKKKYEEYHHVKYADGVIKAIVTFSRRYITDRFLPDKAIDLLDEAGALKKIEADERPAELAELEKQIAILIEEKNQMVESQNYERAAQVRDEVRILRLRAEELGKNRLPTTITARNTVTVHDVCTVLNTITGIPMEQLNTAETSRLLHMEEELHKTVVGQDEAIRLISSAVRRSRAGVSSFKRPQGSFIFLGPTGVGKTLLAKTLARFLFGSEDALIRVDMSDFMEKHTSSRLVGAPPGYVGYEEGGVLTEKVRRNPYSVVLLDEIEKAHPDIFNLLLQMLEEGELRDNLGHTVNFRNTVIIMTSNAGARQITTGNRLGFSSSGDGLMDYDDMKQSALSELKKIMSPELLNRIDDTVVFTTLSKAEVSRILDNQLSEFEDRLKEQGLSLKLKPSAREYLIENGYEPQFGARPMRRLIQREIEDPAALMILAGDVKPGDTITVDFKTGSLIRNEGSLSLSKGPKSRSGLSKGPTSRIGLSKGAAKKEKSQKTVSDTSAGSVALTK